MTILVIRSIILYFLVLLAMKLMGKRQLGQLQPFELVVILIISEMASLAMQSNTIPLLYSVIPIVVLTLLSLLLSLINLKSETLREWLCGRPEALIERGRFNVDTMRRLRLNITDIEELCRAKGYFDLSGVEWAIMETNGQLSVLPRTEKRPLQVGDVLAEPPTEGLARLLILDGAVNKKALRECGLDPSWLAKQLSLRKIKSAREVFVAGVDEEGQFFAQRRSGK